MPTQELIDLLSSVPASNLRLVELAESTSSVFQLLRPWCLGEDTSSSLFIPIRKQAYEYAKAVDLSITAAQSGFNFCEEAICFAGLLDSTTEKQRQDYLRHMHELAIHGMDTAGQAHLCFRDVRITVENLLMYARRETQNSRDKERLDQLERGIKTLEDFSACIQTYISCWNRINMDQKAQETRQHMLLYSYNSIRQQGVLDTWKKLRKDYASYTCTIRFIQDEHADFWTKIRIPNDGHNRTRADLSKFQGFKRNVMLVFAPKSKKMTG